MGGTAIAVFPTLDIVHLVTKPVVGPDFLQDWLSFLCHDQGFRVHLLYSEDAFSKEERSTLAKRYEGVRLHRIEKVSCHRARDQVSVMLADYLDLRYLSKQITPAIVHSHDTRSLLLARYFFSHSPRLHSWWMEDRSAHKLWRVSVERFANYQTWETVDAEIPQLKGPLAQLMGHQIPLPTPETLTGSYERGEAFDTLRELYRTILRSVDLRTKV